MAREAEKCMGCAKKFTRVGVCLAMLGVWMCGPWIHKACSEFSDDLNTFTQQQSTGTAPGRAGRVSFIRKDWTFSKWEKKEALWREKSRGEQSEHEGLVEEIREHKREFKKERREGGECCERRS
jgi:hypothetical protein